METYLSPRLLLRRLHPDDADAFFRLNQDPEVMRYTGDAPFADLAAARDFLLAYDQYERYGYGRWAMVRREEGDFIGWCGLRFNEDSGETDLGFRLFRTEWGKGYATEAAEASLQRGFEELGLSRIIGRAAKANVASIRVLQKVGMRYEREVLCGGMNGVLYVIEK